MQFLDRPVWGSLTTHHASLAEGSALARRFTRDVGAFASARDDTAEAAVEFAALLKPGESVVVLQVPPIVIPAGLVEVKVISGVQMVATQSMAIDTDRTDILTLTDDDASEMLALAELTEGIEMLWAV